MRPDLHVIETTRTPDRVTEYAGGGWAIYRVKPPGDGWAILRDRERHTTWIRRTPMVHPTVRVNRRWLP